jgi:Protein of unknown function (DUF1214)
MITKSRKVATTSILAATATGSAVGGPLPTLDMFEQLQFEERALRIFAMPQVQAQKARAEQHLRASPLAQIPDGQARLEPAATRFALAAVENALIDDPARPKIVWVIDEKRDWHGVHYPGSAWGSKNPDNFSRDLVIDGDSRYEILGRRKGAGPAQMTIIVYSAFPGTDAQSLEGAPVVGALTDSDITFADDGSYTITLGSEPAEPGGNHLQINPEAKFIHIRNALNDWTTQVPDRLRVRRVSGPDALPPRTDTEIADQAASLLALQAPYWLEFFEDKFLKLEPNTVISLGGRAGGWGYISSGRFKLNNNEALVVTVDRIGAEYLGFQVADVWSVPPNYIVRNASLNNGQARPNADGTYTYVIAAGDPGVWNWIDTEGMREGGFTVRWQGIIDRSNTNENAVQEVRLVKLEDLKESLRPETEWIDIEGRQQQLAERAASFARRLAN